MTKPGNSDPAEPTTDKAPAPTEPTPEPEATTEPEPTTPEPAPPAEEVSAESEPDETKSAEPAEAEPEDKPVEAKPVRPSKVRKAAADPEPLMAELEKAPPPPREEAIRAQAKRRFEEPAPRTLRFSFYFFTCSGLVWLVSMIASLIFKQDIIDAQIKNNTNTKITPEQISSAVTQILWIVLVAALAFTVMLALFGYKATEGTRRARTLVTIFSTILVLFHLLLNGTQLGIFSALLALIGLALLWSPSARAYFPPRQVP